MLATDLKSVVKETTLTNYGLIFLILMELVIY